MCLSLTGAFLIIISNWTRWSNVLWFFLFQHRSSSPPPPPPPRIHIPKLSTLPPLPPPPTFLCHSSVPFEFYVIIIFITSHILHIIVMSTCSKHWTGKQHSSTKNTYYTSLSCQHVPSIGQENSTAQPKTDVIFHCFWPFNCCSSVVL